MKSSTINYLQQFPFILLKTTLIHFFYPCFVFCRIHAQKVKSRVIAQARPIWKDEHSRNTNNYSNSNSNNEQLRSQPHRYIITQKPSSQILAANTLQLPIGAASAAMK